MNNFEFKGYIPTPNDKYGMLGLVKIKLYGKMNNVYKHQKTKDGTGTFFCMANYNMENSANEKKYFTASAPDSRDDEEELMDFIRKEVTKHLSQSTSALPTQVRASQEIHYPHGMIKQQEVAADEQLPF